MCTLFECNITYKYIFPEQFLKNKVNFLLKQAYQDFFFFKRNIILSKLILSDIIIIIIKTDIISYYQQPNSTTLKVYNPKVKLQHLCNPKYL